MESALALHRLHFAFTITYHYLFPQLTMGLAPLIVIFKTLALWKKDERYNRASRFWAKIFAINFFFGVITGVPMEFQFGTSWARFSQYSGGVIATALAMEGVFAFFLESSFLGIFLFGEKRFGPKVHWLSAFMIFAGSWISGFFIIVTDAWMQHPVGFQIGADGTAHLSSFWALMSNEWAFWQYLHNMGGAVITGAFAMAAVGAFYLLSGRQVEYGRLFLRAGVVAAAAASLLQLFPSGDEQGRLVTENQPATLAAMEGLFNTEAGAGIVLVCQPDTDHQKLDNPIYVPKMLSFLTHRRWEAEVKGLNEFPRDLWPDNIALLYYSYHIMVGLGTLFVLIAGAAAFLLWRRRLYDSRWMLWILMLSVPFPYIANTAGWITAEVGHHYLAMKTEGDVQARARRFAGPGWLALALLTTASLVATLSIRPQVLDNFRSYPWGWIIPLGVLGSLIAMPLCRRRGSDRAAFLASTAFLAFMLGGAAFALYPYLLPASTNPAWGLTVHNAKTGDYSLRVGLIWWGLGMALAVGYFTFLYRSFRGKVAPHEGEGY